MLRILVHDMAILLACLVMYVFRRFHNTRRRLLDTLVFITTTEGRIKAQGAAARTRREEGRRGAGLTGS